LFLWRKTVVLLVLSITQGSAQIQAAIYSPKTHHAARFGDSIDLLCILWFVVFAQLFSLPTDASYCSRVSCICAVNELWSDQNDVSSATRMRVLFVLGAIVDFPHLFLNGYDLLFSGLTKNKLIHSEESLFQGELVITLDVILICFQLLNEMPFNKLGYFGAWVNNEELPPCPSKTAKSEFFLSLRGETERCASSM
jgi:hypothetical protein